MKVILGCDHRGLELKEAAKGLLQELNIPFEDFGAIAGEAVDYPDIAGKVGRAVVESQDTRGLLFCGTGLGMAMAANKIPGVRAASVCGTQAAILSRRHNDANVLALGEITVTPEASREIIRVWLETPFDGGRHQRRVDKIMQLEQEPRKNA
jgi:ribose 5-phosphate isomerase B